MKIEFRLLFLNSCDSLQHSCADGEAAPEDQKCLTSFGLRSLKFFASSSSSGPGILWADPWSARRICSCNVAAWKRGRLPVTCTRVVHVTGSPFVKFKPRQPPLVSGNRRLILRYTMLTTQTKLKLRTRACRLVIPPSWRYLFRQPSHDCNAERSRCARGRETNYTDESLNIWILW